MIDGEINLHAGLAEILLEQTFCHAVTGERLRVDKRGEEAWTADTAETES